MEYNRIRYFIAVAKYQNMTRAAEELHVAEPAISQAVKRLSNELGIRLFERKGRNIVLTADGKRLYEKAAPLIRALDDMSENIAQEKNTEHSVIHLNLQSVPQLFLDVINDFRTSHTQATFRLSDAGENDMSWDIRITSASEKLRYVKSVPLLSEPVMIAVSKSHPLAHQDSVSLNELKGMDFIFPEESDQFSAFLHGYCQMVSFRPHIIYSSGSVEALEGMIASGLGIGFWPVRSWSQKSDQVHLLSIDGPQCERTIYLENNEAVADKPLKDEFFEYASHYFM